MCLPILDTRQLVQETIHLFRKCHRTSTLMKIDSVVSFICQHEHDIPILRKRRHHFSTTASNFHKANFFFKDGAQLGSAKFRHRLIKIVSVYNVLLDVTIVRNFSLKIWAQLGLRKCPRRLMKMIDSSVLYSFM